MCQSSDIRPSTEEWSGATDSSLAGGNNTIHANRGKKCIQMVGTIIKDAEIDHAIAKKMATKGWSKVEEGPCSKQFAESIYNKNNITIWS